MKQSLVRAWRPTAITLACVLAVLNVSAAPDADLIFSGGDVVTMNPRQPEAGAVAIRGGRIIAVGSKIICSCGHRTVWQLRIAVESAQPLHAARRAHHQQRRTGRPRQWLQCTARRRRRYRNCTCRWWNRVFQSERSVQPIRAQSPRRRVEPCQQSNRSACATRTSSNSARSGPQSTRDGIVPDASEQVFDRRRHSAVPTCCHRSAGRLQRAQH